MRAVVPLLLCLACASDDPADTATDPGAEPTTLFSDAVTTVALEVDFAPGAQPYTADGDLSGVDPWDLFEANADALFDGEKALEIPH